MSDTLWIDNGDVAVRQALAAADAALESGVPVQRWCDMRFAAASQAVRADRLYQSMVDDCKGKLSAYDEEHGTNLVETGRALVRTQGDVGVRAPVPAPEHHSLPTAEGQGAHGHGRHVGPAVHQLSGTRFSAGAGRS